MFDEGDEVKLSRLYFRNVAHDGMKSLLIERRS